jgi:hypothetical protein
MRLLAFIVALLSVAAIPAHAQQLDLGKKHYEKGDPGGSINELQFAIQDIRSQLAMKYRTSLPDAPPGWTSLERVTAGWKLDELMNAAGM